MPDCPQCATGTLFNIGIMSNAKSKTMVMVHCNRCTYGTVRVKPVKPKSNHHA